MKLEKYISYLRLIPGIFRNRMYVRGVRVLRKNVFQGGKLICSTKVFSSGKDNIIDLSALGGLLSGCVFHFLGSDNHVVVGSNCHLTDVDFWVEDNNNTILIGDNCNMMGKTQLAVIEGTKIAIGNDCLFSSTISFRTGDSHSILNLDGERINKSKDIRIGNHVWIGTQVLINKGVVVGDNCVVGNGSILTKPFTEQNVVLAGVPAKVVKRNITWDSRRLPFGGKKQ